LAAFSATVKVSSLAVGGSLTLVTLTVMVAVSVSVPVSSTWTVRL